MSLFALDIETISPGAEPSGSDFRDSSFFEMLAVGVGYQSESMASPDIDVLFREGATPQSEADLLDRLYDWFDSRIDSDEPVVLTYNGDAFDMIHLRGRARISGQEVGSRPTFDAISHLLDRLTHDDLKDDVWAAYGNYTSLENACRKAGIPVEEVFFEDYNHGLTVDWRTGNSPVTSSDVPHIGSRYLELADTTPTTEQAAALHNLLYDYTVADIGPLFKLAESRPL